MIWLAILAGFVNLIAFYFRIPKKLRKALQSNFITAFLVDFGLPILVVGGIMSAPNLAVVVIALAIGALFDIVLWSPKLFRFGRALFSN